MSEFNCRLRNGCQVSRAHKIIKITYMPTVDLFIAFWSPRISRIITKDEAMGLINHFNLYFHPALDGKSDWGHYKTIPFRK